MKILYGLAGLISTAIILTGCSAIGQGGRSSVPITGQNFGDDAPVDAVAAVTGFKRTNAQGEGHTVDKALAQSGLSGAGVSLGGNPISAASTGPTFTTATARIDGNNLNVKVGDKTYNIPNVTRDLVGSQNSQEFLGTTYSAQVYTNANIPDGRSTNGQTYSGDAAVMLNAQYSSILAVAGGVDLKAHTGPEPWDAVSFTGNVDNLALVTMGLETPAENLPKAKASYTGIWGAGGLNTGSIADIAFPGTTTATGTAGTFTANADFQARQIGFSLLQPDQADWVDVNDPDRIVEAARKGTIVGSGTATLANGGQFVGTLTIQDAQAGQIQDYDVNYSDMNGSMTLIGGIYGPTGQEIAGTMKGTLGNSPAVGALFGIKD